MVLIAPALRHLPREARDTLFLLLVIAWVVGMQAAITRSACSTSSTDGAHVSLAGST